MAERPEVAAIVLNWRLPEATLHVLEDLRACEHASLDVLLIDNGSGDDSAVRLDAAARELDNFECLNLERNVGYCAAINLGVAWAVERAADYVLLLNNDVRLAPDFLTPLVETLTNDPSVGVVGPTIVDPAGRAWSQGGGVRFRPNLVVLHNQGGVPAPREHGPEEVEFLPGACALFRLDALRELGGLDESYFMYWEDVDLGRRMRAIGKKNLWLPWVQVVHDVSASSGGGRSPLRKYMQAVNSVRFLKHHGSVSSWLAFVLFECLLWPIAFFSGTGPKAALAKGRGLVAGLLGKRVSVADVERYAPRRTR